MTSLLDILAGRDTSLGLASQKTKRVQSIGLAYALSLRCAFTSANQLDQNR